MYLKRLFIRGFRSISELDLDFQPGKNVIIGRNNSGKSNIVQALDVVLGESAPAYAKSENITEADFYSARVIAADGNQREQVTDTVSIWCELRREAKEELDWGEINKCFGYSFHGKRGWNAPGEPYRLPIKDLSKDFESIFSINEDEVQDKVWVDSKLKNQNTFQQQLREKYQFSYAFLAHRTEEGITKQIRFLYRESDSEDWVLAFRASVRTELLQSAILPAFRDPVSQLRLAPWTWFGKLMKELTKDCDNDKELTTALEQVRSAGNRVFAQVTKKIENNTLSVSFPDAKLSFQFNADTKGDLYKSCVVYVDDGFKSMLTDKGAGIQSATILGLFSYYTEHVNTTGSALLCVEEPELYLHPHARRVISDRLDEFLDHNRNQVIITTHGIEFVRTSDETFNLILVRKGSDGGTTAQTIDAREFLVLLVNNNQNELFFADKVILCEGQDEHILRAAADELFPGELDRQNISIVAVGGKDAVISMCKVLQKLSISCLVFADFDFLLRDTTKVEEYDTKAHPSVEHLPKEFFSQTHVGAAAGAKLQGQITLMRNKLRKENPKCFYEGKHSKNFKEPGLPLMIKELRQRGIGLLNGEIEDLFKDKGWMGSAKKFGLQQVYQMREYLAAGKTMKDLIDLGPVKEFLTPIIGKKDVNDKSP
jgi:putative ATP-dependent endonuclease of the OLD family